MVWQANEEMYGPGGGDWVDELGQVTPDPYGELNPANAGAPPGVANFIQNVIPKPATPAPAAHAAPAAPAPLSSPQGMAAAMDAPMTPPNLVPGQSNKAPGGGAPPNLTPGQSNQPSMIPVTQTTKESSTTTQGMDKASAAKVEGATGAANAAADKVGALEAGNLNASADMQRQQAQGAYGRGVNDYFQKWGELQVQEQISAETDAKLQEAAKFKPDRTALFRGDTGLLFGLSAAISAMAGGWLMGQGLTGGKNPYLDSILQMIDDDANDQINQNSATMEQLTRILGDSKAAGKELKARMLGSVSDTIQAQSKFQDADQVQRGAAVVMARVEAEKAKNQMDAAKLTATSVTKQVQSRSQTQMVANPQAYGGLDVNDAKVQARMDKVGALENLYTTAMSLQASGELADNTGLIDEAVGSVKRGLRMRNPGQKKVEDFRALLESANRADWASEPNGQEVQLRLSQIGVPQNDAEIPLAIQKLREAVNVIDPGGRFRAARRALGDRPPTAETGTRTPIVR